MEQHSNDKGLLFNSGDASFIRTILYYIYTSELEEFYDTRIN